jgi:hypothetical protein
MIVQKMSNIPTTPAQALGRAFIPKSTAQQVVPGGVLRGLRQLPTPSLKTCGTVGLVVGTGMAVTGFVTNGSYSYGGLKFEVQHLDLLRCAHEQEQVSAVAA